jgi:DNA repair protein RecO (recombination protein O)
MNSTFSSGGIVFRTIKYGETSIICDIFTKEKGLRSYIVSGVRMSKTKTKANFYRPLNILEITAYDSESDKLSRIKEVGYSHVFRLINTDVIRSSVALFMLEVTRNAIKTGEEDKELYDYLEKMLISLDTKPEFSPLIHHKFLLDLSAFLGFEPMQNYDENKPVFNLLNGFFEKENSSVQYVMDPETSENLISLMRQEKDTLYELIIPRKNRQKLLDDLIIYYRLHIPGFKEILSKDVLEMVL